MTSRLFRGIVPLLIVGFVALSFNEASARAGRSRSFGSRGTSSYRSPTQSAPSYDSRPYSSSSPYSQTRPFSTGQQGGFLRGLAGGVVGGLLGGMLFRSLGFAGSGAGMGGGIGLFEIALLAGGAYLLYRFVSGRRRVSPAGGSSGFFGLGLGGDQAGLGASRLGPQEGGSWGAAPRAVGGGLEEGLSRIRDTDPSFDEASFRDTAQDLFFRIQGAWTRRDLSPVERLLGEEVSRTLHADVDELKQRGEVNRLENIAVREAEIVEAWQEQGQDHLTLRLLASLLDYTTDETGKVLSGSDSEPVKFEEYWTLARPTGGGSWRLTAIQQA